MSLDDENKKVLGGIAGATGGAYTAAQAALILSPLAGPFAPLVIIGALVAGGAAGATVGYRDPAAGALTALGVAAGLPVPTPGTGGS